MRHKKNISCHCGLDPQSFEKHLRAIAGQARNDTTFVVFFVIKKQINSNFYFFTPLNC
ncbi:MAG: hypothetical protein LBN95_09655 [Prevotellaceae bacterium]|jgi:hypothetical protein|nr:hypothetical protein [Prevotellaceae bacterium]